MFYIYRPDAESFLIEIKTSKLSELIENPAIIKGLLTSLWSLKKESRGLVCCNT